MKKLRTFIVLLVLVLGISLIADEQPGKFEEVFKLWPNEVQFQLSKEKQQPEKWGKWGFVNVHEPTLAYYPAKKEKANGMAILVIPGGGYSQVCINHEGHRVGEWFSDHGIAAFVLKYRCQPYQHPVPLMDAQRALRLIRFNAKKFNIKPDRIGVIGFSAGGHLASSLSVHYDLKTKDAKDEIDKVSARPDFAVLLYPVISMEPGIVHQGSRNNLIGKNPDPKLLELMSTDKQVNKNTPPTFLVHGKADKGVLPKNSELYLAALKENKVPAELLMVDNAGHGFGLGNNWADKCLEWLVKTLSD